MAVIVALLLLAPIVCPCEHVLPPTTTHYPTRPEIVECALEEGPLTWQSKTVLWTPIRATNSVRYYWLTGDVHLPVGAWTCVSTTKTHTDIRVDADPPPGVVWGYLVKGWNACGAGTWGYAAAGMERIAPACGI